MLLGFFFLNNSGCWIPICKMRWIVVLKRCYGNNLFKQFSEEHVVKKLKTVFSGQGLSGV